MYAGLFIFVLYFFGATEAVCPPDEEIFPCGCDESRLQISCTYDDNVTTPWDIKPIFDRLSTLVPEDTIFNTLLVSTYKLKEIPAGAIQSVKFRSITIEHNDILEYIHPDAFTGTLETTVNLTIGTNMELTNDGPGHTPDDIFNVIRKFRNLERLHMGLFYIRFIPDDALGSLPNLTYFQFSTGNLTSIGSRAFAGLPNLNYLGLTYSEISLEEIADDAFEGIGSDAEVNLEKNPFTRLPETIFKPLLDNARSVRVGGSNCNIWFCAYDRLDCDEVSEWICEDVEKYRQVLNGFNCRPNPMYDIFEYCAQLLIKST